MTTGGEGSVDDEGSSSWPTAGSRSGRKGREARRHTAKAVAREQTIYAAAARIFYQKGYSAASIQDIADEVGLLKGSLYYYIDGKEDLLYGITRTIHDLALTFVERTLALDDTPAERLRFLLHLHITSFGENLPMISVFYTEHDSLQGERRAEVMRDRAKYERFVRSLIVEGQEAGQFCPELDARLVSNAVLTMSNTIYMWYRPGAGPGIEQVASTYADFAIRGLSCPDGHRHAER